MKKNQISWLGQPEARILSIRSFRKYIDTVSFEEAVNVTQHIWESSPKLNNNTFDITNVDAWPNPWDLFSQQAYCANLQTLGAFYTLALSDHAKNHDIELAIVQDTIFGEQAKLRIDSTDAIDSTICVVTQSDITHKLGD